MACRLPAHAKSCRADVSAYPKPPPGCAPLTSLKFDFFPRPMLE
jgi:hypothetical protein